MKVVMYIVRTACGKGLQEKSLHTLFKKHKVTMAEAHRSRMGQQVLKAREAVDSRS